MLIVMVGVTFSFACDINVSAAVKKPGKVTLKKVVATGQTTVGLSWGSVPDAKGYEVYRNGKKIKTVKGVSHADKGLRAGTKYTYKVRAYKTYKQKLWKNKKTKKWQKKKPKKKYRGKSKKVTKKAYGAFSVAKTVTTRKSSSPSPTVRPTTASNTIKVTGLKYSWCEYGNGNSSYYAVDLEWNPAAGADKYNVYKGSAFLAQTSDPYCYEISASTTSSTTFYVAAVKNGVTGVKSGITVQPRTGGGGGTVTPTGTPSGGGLPEYPNITFNYVNGSFYLGQAWSTTLDNTLSRGSSGRVKITRKNANDWGEGLCNQDVYMYDTGDYNNFLTVYVSKNQIIGWWTNRTNMGQEGNNVLNRGDTDKPSMLISCAFDNREGKVPGYPKSSSVIILGGFAYSDALLRPSGWSPTVSDEKIIGFHMINAFRYICGKPIAERKLILEGLNSNGNPLYVNGKRFGAQAWAETMNASKSLVHQGIMTAGPLATAGKVTHAYCYGSPYQYDPNSNIDITGEAITDGGPAGEQSLHSFEGKPTHLDLLLSGRYIGIGMSGKYICIHPGEPVL